MTKGSLKAYVVTDEIGDARAEVIFGRFNAEARRKGACAMDLEWDCVSCRRAPWFDGLDPGPVSDQALIGAGWWLECGCGEHMDEERGVFFWGETAVCSRACAESAILHQMAKVRRS